jgi:hypothetical protein
MTRDQLLAAAEEGRAARLAAYGVACTLRESVAITAAVSPVKDRFAAVEGGVDVQVEATASFAITAAIPYRWDKFTTPDHGTLVIASIRKDLIRGEYVVDLINPQTSSA